MGSRSPAAEHTPTRTLQAGVQKASFKPATVAAKPAAVSRVVSCSAEKQGSKATAAAAAAALAVALCVGAVEPAYADISGLTPCAESKAFAKRKKNEVKGLSKRLKQVRRERRAP